MSDNASDDNVRPDVVRAVIEFEDGSKKVATGDDAQKWADWLDAGVGWAVSHGQEPPDIEFDSVPGWLNSSQQDTGDQQQGSGQRG